MGLQLSASAEAAAARVSRGNAGRSQHAPQWRQVGAGTSNRPGSGRVPLPSRSPWWQEDVKQEDGRSKAYVLAV
jgi:hypothetical protein